MQAGINAQCDFYLVGAEVAVEDLTGDVGDFTYGQILGWAGLVVTDDVLVYAAGGYGIDLGAPDEADVLLAGGLEHAVSENVSVEAEYLHGLAMDVVNAEDQFSVGANFRFCTLSNRDSVGRGSHVLILLTNSPHLLDLGDSPGS